MKPATPSSIEPAEVIRGLLRPEAYTHPVDTIELKETHGAWVVLAGAYAYKLKKPVDFGFFDYSTSSRRAADAEAEVRLNRRLAPSTYLGLVDVVERDGNVFMGGEGRVIERAVWMRRLPEAGMLTTVLREGTVSSRRIRRIARLIAGFHRDAPTGPGIDEFGEALNLAANWRENFEQIRPYVGVTLAAEQLEAIKRSIERFLAGQRDLLHRRVAQGRIRDGHGDLHAGSICLVGHEIVVFDCIQFSARYRCADVAGEVAFLSMDLDHVGRADLGWAFIDEYVKRSGDDELADLLGFYKCYRAFVRGKVFSLRLSQGTMRETDRQNTIDQARSYFDLATTYANSAIRPRLVVMSGLPASGKSTLAKTLSSRLGLVHLSTDVTRKRRAGMHPTDRAATTFETGLYGADVTRATYTQLRRDAAKWLRRGVSVVLDGTFGSPRERNLTRKLALRYQAGFSLIVTQCDEVTTRRRIENRRRDLANVSDADWTTYESMRRMYSAPNEVPDEEKLVDPSGGIDADGVVARLASWSD